MIKRRLFALLLAAAASAGFTTAWGQGTDITFSSDGYASPTTFSSTKWVGIDGSRPTIGVKEVNSISTTTASSDVYGIKLESGKNLTVGSLSGGITLKGSSGIYAIYSALDASLTIADINQLEVNSTSEYSRGIYNAGTVTLIASDCSITATAATSAYGIYNTGTLNATLSSISAHGNTTNVYGIYCKSSGTATVTVGTISASTDVDPAIAVQLEDKSTLTLLAQDNKPISVTGHINIASGCTLNIGYAGIVFASSTGSICSNEGTILVDMTGATEDSYTLIDAASTLTCTYGTYQFAEGKDNGYLLKVEANDLIAYKAEPLSVTVGETGYATIYSESKLSIPEGVTVLDYSFDGTNFNLNASYTEGTLAGGKGYIITAKPGKYEFAVSTGTPLTCESCLKGCTEDTPASGKVYVFDIIDGIPGFYLYTGTLKAGKAYYIEVPK